ncbi:cyclic nucleotide-binding domain-containing protein [Oleisolibacter albus]|uniref:cyclic nucleotide-binding domain-containing protein n=1 Tax=Oleisolibacter albus TaxID=2171757 RepID=UPI000DF23AF4|nr:cyclic nucleotide-binding domain-containing protein [Oleisolibacter albus]
MRKVLYIMGLLNDADMAWMAGAGRRLRPRPGDVLIRQGEPADDLFIVLGGEVTVELADGSVLARMGSGEVLGEMSFVDRAPPSATVRAGEGCQVLALDKRAMEARLAGDSGFAARFYKALAVFLADRLRSTTQRMTTGPDGSIGGDALLADELDETVLDQVSMAGLRFEQMLKILAGG